MRERRSLRPTYYNTARDYGWRRLLSIVSTKPFCLPYEAWPGLSGASRGRELDNGGVFNNHSRSSRLADQRVTYRTRYCVRACVTWNVGLWLSVGHWSVSDDVTVAASEGRENLTIAVPADWKWSVRATGRGKGGGGVKFSGLVSEKEV